MPALLKNTHLHEEFQINTGLFQTSYLTSKEAAPALTLMQSKPSAAHLMEKQEKKRGWQSLGYKPDTAPFPNKPITLNSGFTIHKAPEKIPGAAPVD